MQKKVAIYCRISNKYHTNTESESIQNQKQILKNYAQKKHWTIYDIYCDENYSGLYDNRPDFKRMLNDAENGCFSIILCKTQSRFTRNIVTAEKYLHHLFPAWGIQFVTIVEHINSNDRQNKKTMQINSLINEWYCEELSENIKKVFRQKQKQGQFLGNYAPYGYQKSSENKHKLVIDKNTAHIIQFIFEQYAYQKKSYATIAQMLTSQNIPTPSQYKMLQGKDMGRKGIKQYGVWSASTIRNILHNGVYIGHMIQNKENKINFKCKKVVGVSKENWIVAKNTHEPIITYDLFMLCQKKYK